MFLARPKRYDCTPLDQIEREPSSSLEHKLPALNTVSPNQLRPSLASARRLRKPLENGWAETDARRRE